MTPSSSLSAPPNLTVDEAREIALGEALNLHGAREVVVIGCGNPLRGDDAFGPALIQRLWNEGVPDGVHLVDGGTGGMDVAFKMRDAEHVIVVDAATTGSAPGTVFRVPGEQLEHLPPVDGMHSHQFRWDHALAFGRWLLAEHYPRRVTVYLVEAGALTHGAELSEPVAKRIDEVIGLVRAHFPAPAVEPVDTPVVEFTDGGSVLIDAALAAEYFAGDALVAVPKGDELWLYPLVGTSAGGLLLKHRNARGDRVALVAESLRQCDGAEPVGTRRATWDASQGALRVALRP